MSAWAYPDAFAPTFSESALVPVRMEATDAALPDADPLIYICALPLRSTATATWHHTFCSVVAVDVTVAVDVPSARRYVHEFVDNRPLCHPASVVVFVFFAK